MSSSEREIGAVDRIIEEAGQWMVLAEDGGLDRDRQRAFDAWCAADARHRPAYESARELWNEMPGFDNLGALAPSIAEPISHRLSSRRFRYAAGGLAAIAAVLLAVILIPGAASRSDAQYKTELATTRIVALQDGSSVTLGARSAIKVSFSRGERRVVLTGGEAFFDVIHDANRPFVVEAGNSIIHDIGTKFDVNLTKGSVRVSVLEGIVSVARTNANSAKPQLLKAGERAEVMRAATAQQPAITSSSSMPVPSIVAQRAQAPGSWREGRLVFDNVRLADLADDLSRYYGPGVRVSDDVADLRVTASFKTSEIPFFMRSLSESFPVRSSSVGGGTYEVRAAGR